MSKKTWGAKFTNLVSQAIYGVVDLAKDPHVAGSLARSTTAALALPLAASLLLGGIATADQSILVRSDNSSNNASESSAVSVGTVPAQLVPAAAEHISSSFHAQGENIAAEDSSQTGTIKLKWRARHPNSFALGGTKQDPAVQQAAQLTELNSVGQANNTNAFDDPFEDRTRGQFATNAQEAQPGSGGFRDLSQDPRSNRPAPGESLLSPQQSGSVDCPDKTYNRRNCCDELRNCATAQQTVRDYDITNISLDISPSIKSHATRSEKDATTPEELEQYKSQQLIQAASRTWHDEKNNILTTGSLVDYSNNRVYIATDDGDIKKYAFGMLSADDRCFVSAWWNIPAGCKLGTEQFAGRFHQPMTMTWTASQVCHKPLYFEEIALERYGHTAGPIVQPWISGAHFFTNIAILPYRMGINPLGECQYDLGYYRPGNCAPWLINPIPLSPRGALFQAGAVTGVSYLIP